MAIKKKRVSKRHEESKATGLRLIYSSPILTEDGSRLSVDEKIEKAFLLQSRKLREDGEQSKAKCFALVE